MNGKATNCSSLTRKAEILLPNIECNTFIFSAGALYAKSTTQKTKDNILSMMYEHQQLGKSGFLNQIQSSPFLNCGQIRRLSRIQKVSREQKVSRIKSRLLTKCSKKTMHINYNTPMTTRFCGNK